MSNGENLGFEPGHHHVRQIHARQKSVLLGEDELPENRHHASHRQQGRPKAGPRAPRPLTRFSHTFGSWGRHLQVLQLSLAWPPLQPRGGACFSLPSRKSEVKSRGGKLKHAPPPARTTESRPPAR